MGEPAHGLGLRLVNVATGISRVGARLLAGRGLERRREEQRLAIARGAGDDPVDRRLEAHVEHPVGLVDDQDPYVLEAQRPALEQILEPARRGDHDVGPARELGLLLEPDPAVDRGDREPPDPSDVAKLIDDLAGELAGRREHQRGRLAAAGLEQVGDRHAEGQGLARAGRGLNQDVAPGEDVGDDQLLDCEWRDDAALLEGVRNRTRNAEIGERHVVQLLVSGGNPETRTHSECTEERNSSVATAATDRTTVAGHPGEG